MLQIDGLMGPLNTMATDVMGMLPNNVGGFGDVEKAAKVFARNEIAPLQARMAHAINTWAGTTVCSFKPYLLEDAPAATA